MFIPGKLYRTKVFVRRAWQRGEARTPTLSPTELAKRHHQEFWWSPVMLSAGTLMMLISTRSLEEGVDGVVATFFGHGDRHFIFLEDERVVKVVLPRNIEMELPRKNRDPWASSHDNLMRFEEMFEEASLLPEEE